MAKFEKTQPGNPHKLTIRQHVYPRASIERFADAAGRVKVRFLADHKTVHVTPDADVFCAMRAWDQRHERLVGKQIEDAFQGIAEEIVAGRNKLDEKQHETVTYFRSLWQLRAHHRDHPVPDEIAKGVTPSNLTLDQCEILESNHVAYVGPDGRFPGRTLAGMQIQIGMDRFAIHNAGARWGILRSKLGEFLLPDQFGEFGYIPISPHCILAIGTGDGFLGFEKVRSYNRAANREAKRYIVARNFAACPL